MENKIFQGTKRLIDIRCKINAVGDYKNLAWLTPYNMHIAGYLRTNEEQKLYCIFNFSDKETGLSWRVFKEHGPAPSRLYDHWMDKEHIVGNDNESLVIAPYQFYLFEQVDVF
jgi:amylosucrase